MDAQRVDLGREAARVARPLLLQGPPRGLDHVLQGGTLVVVLVLARLFVRRHHQQRLVVRLLLDLRLGVLLVGLRPRTFRQLEALHWFLRLLLSSIHNLRVIENKFILHRDLIKRDEIILSFLGHDFFRREII